MNGVKVSWYSGFLCLLLLLLLFFFRFNGKNNTSLKTIFVTVMVMVSKGQFLKLLDISCFQSYEQLRDTLTTAFERHFPMDTSLSIRHRFDVEI